MTRTTTRTETRAKHSNPTVRAVHEDGTTFHIEMVPQRVGAMGAEVEGAFRARIRLEGSANGGLDPQAAIKRLADFGKRLSESKIVQEDIDALPMTPTQLAAVG